MKTCYYKKLSNIKIAVLDVCHFEEQGCFIIPRLNVPMQFRGQGIASELLSECCRDADKEDATLYLCISPSDGLDYNQLEQFYMRYGFRRQLTSYYMRVPGAPITPRIAR